MYFFQSRPFLFTYSLFSPFLEYHIKAFFLFFSENNFQVSLIWPNFVGRELKDTSQKVNL